MKERTQSRPEQTMNKPHGRFSKQFKSPSGLHWSCMFALLMVLASCSGKRLPENDVTVLSQENAAMGGIEFVVEPDVVHACAGRDRVTSVIKWNVSRPEVKAIKVLVGDSSSAERKTLAMMGGKGEANTGNWVVEGTTFDLVDAQSGKRLATTTVRALPCQ
jgi:hypothetical protein